MALPPRLLVADDQPDVLEAVRMLARAHGFDVRTATSPAAVLALCEAEDLDVCLLDLNYARDTTSGVEGMALLERLRELDPTLPVVVMTAWGSIEGAVEAVRRGARDYLQKPWDNTRLIATLTGIGELPNVVQYNTLIGPQAMARFSRRRTPGCYCQQRAETIRVVRAKRSAPQPCAIRRRP